MPYTVPGLPTHALIVHATVVVLPLTTLLLLCAFSGRVRARPVCCSRSPGPRRSSSSRSPPARGNSSTATSPPAR